MLETGSHDSTDPNFGLIINPIQIEDGAWIGSKALILPGSIIKTHAVISAGSVFSGIAKPYGIYVGNPATFAFQRIINHTNVDKETK
jgi:putative colanic acid biosynthesis acetyltransferase WcaF